MIISDVSVDLMWISEEHIINITTFSFLKELIATGATLKEFPYSEDASSNL